MFRARGILVRLSAPLKPQKTRNFCTKSDSKNKNSNNENEKIESSVSRYHETYKQLENLDFMTAAKILFTEPPKKKKFGFDFHLVQFFFACLPSLAVYLVAQYARREMKKMDAQLDEKKRKEEEEKAKAEEEQKASEEKIKTDAHTELEEVKVRLDKIEETINEIAVESKKQSRHTVTKTREEDATERKKIAAGESKEFKDSKSGLCNEQGSLNQGKVSSSAPVSNDQKGKNQNGKPQAGR